MTVGTQFAPTARAVADAKDTSKEPRPAGRGFCKPRGNLSPLRYELQFLPALPSGVSWQIFMKRSTPSGSLENAPRPKVRLQLGYIPEGPVEHVGKGLRVVSLRIQGDLERFKEFIEQRARESGAWRGQV